MRLSSFTTLPAANCLSDACLDAGTQRVARSTARVRSANRNLPLDALSKAASAEDQRAMNTRAALLKTFISSSRWVLAARSWSTASW